MNEIVNSILVAGDKFINEIHLGQPGFTYRAYGNSKLKKKKTGDSRYIYLGYYNCLWRF